MLDQPTGVLRDAPVLLLSDGESVVESSMQELQEEAGEPRSYIGNTTSLSFRRLTCIVHYVEKAKPLDLH